MTTNDPKRSPNPAPHQASSQPHLGEGPRRQWQQDQVHGGHVFMGPLSGAQPNSQQANSRPSHPGQPESGAGTRPQATAQGTNRKKPARPTAARQRRTSGPSRAYVALWAVLAGVSMAYLAVLTVNPEVLVALGTPVIPADPESNHGQRFAAKLATDVQSLQQTVTELRGEVTALRSGAVAVKTSAPAFDLNSLEAKLSEERTPEPKLQARLGTPLDGTRVAGMVITNPGLPQPVAPPTVASGPLGLELVVGPSVDALRLNWGVLAERHGAALKTMEARYNAASPAGPFQLLVGPVASTEEGIRLCEHFRVKGTPCKVGPFGGQGF